MSVKIEKQDNSKVVLEFTMSKEDFNKNLAWTTQIPFSTIMSIFAQ